jgi:Protein phosphatase 2C
MRPLMTASPAVYPGLLRWVVTAAPSPASSSSGPPLWARPHLTGTRLSETGPVPGQLGDGEIPGWRVFTTVARGAAHRLDGRPLQDAAGFATYAADEPPWLAVVVADGHGGYPHFRSARGSELAVEAGLRLAPETATGLAAGRPGRDISLAARTDLVPGLIGYWRRAVEQDLSKHPWTGREQRMLLPDGDITVPYGSTLLLALLAAPWLLLCQIGDGEVVMVGADGNASLPVPTDPWLDGYSTTSLCQPDAAGSFRLALVDLAASQAAAVLLATDGFGNAQAADPWYQPVGGDLVRLARERGIDWLGEQLPLWAARCASAEGSGDDTTVALLLRTENSPAGDVTLSEEDLTAGRTTLTWPAIPVVPPADPASPGR